MAKHKFTGEYSMKCTSKMLFYYLSTAEGLAQWFADKAVIDGEKGIYSFEWDNKEHFARIIHNKPLKSHKFEFLSDTKDIEPDAGYIELRAETSELTQEVFLVVTDYSSASEPELVDLWEGLVGNLRSQLGS